eukprot:scaffold80456_cov78-Phaeocystis_antarctica.AAC.2
MQLVSCTPAIVSTVERRYLSRSGPTLAGYFSRLNRLTDLSSKFAAQVTFIVSDFAPACVDELDLNVLSTWVEAERQTI